MSRINPYGMEADWSRRLSLALTLIAVLGWFTWIGFLSNGYAHVQPVGWVILFAVPVVTILGLVLISRFVKSKAVHSKRVRVVCAGSAMWVVCLFAWGYIWRWQLHFAERQYVALFVLPIGAAWFGLILWSWVSSASRK